MLRGMVMLVRNHRHIQAVRLFPGRIRARSIEMRARYVGRMRLIMLMDIDVTKDGNCFIWDRLCDWWKDETQTCTGGKTGSVQARQLLRRLSRVLERRDRN